MVTLAIYLARFTISKFYILSNWIFKLGQCFESFEQLWDDLASYMKSLTLSKLPVFRYFTGFFKNFRWIWFQIRNSSSCPHVCSFITIPQLFPNCRFFGFSPVFEKNTPENPTSDSEPTPKVTYIRKFSSRSDNFSILTPNLAGPYKWSCYYDSCKTWKSFCSVYEKVQIMWNS